MPSSQPADEGHEHGAMNHGEHEGMVMASQRIPLQQVVDIATARKVSPGYSITPPVGTTGVYTIAIFADDPRNDATLHIDQYSGKVLADVRWQDYGPVAKTVESGVMLHMGKLYGWPHRRSPPNFRRCVAPSALLIPLGIAFPLVVAIWLLDILLFSRRTPA